MTDKDLTRAWKAGEALGRSVVESVQLMYQNNTAMNYLKGLHREIEKEIFRRQEFMLRQKNKKVKK